MTDITSNLDSATFLLSSVRFSKDKNTKLFVDVVDNLGSDFFIENHIIPVYISSSFYNFLSMVGTAMDKEYAESITDRLQRIVPSSIIKSFVTPSELVTIWKQTLINFHPALYEAYGKSTWQQILIAVRNDNRRMCCMWSSFTYPQWRYHRSTRSSGRCCTLGRHDKTEWSCPADTWSHFKPSWIETSEWSGKKEGIILDRSGSGTAIIEVNTEHYIMMHK